MREPLPSRVTGHSSLHLKIFRELRIRGQVQGVGFREALRREAMRLGISGWVRNRADGTVEALVIGDAAAVEQITDWARTGPPAARVDAVEIREAQSREPVTGFEKRPTL